MAEKYLLTRKTFKKRKGKEKRNKREKKVVPACSGYSIIIMLNTTELEWVRMKSRIKIKTGNNHRSTNCSTAHQHAHSQSSSLLSIVTHTQWFTHSPSLLHFFDKSMMITHLSAHLTQKYIKRVKWKKIKKKEKRNHSQISVALSLLSLSLSFTAHSRREV